jgi:hypothetical protein
MNKWLRKIFGNKEKYCSDFGHSFKKEYDWIQRQPKDEWRCVLVKALLITTKCTHCGLIESQEESPRGKVEYTGASLPDSHWEEIRLKGYRKIKKAVKGEKIQINR